MTPRPAPGHGDDVPVDDRPTVVLADDHAATRAGVRATLEQSGFTVVGEAATADGAVEEATRHRPAVCLLDLSMPGGGVNAARRIRDEAPESKVVILTVSPIEEDLVDAVMAGASGYLLKGMAASQLPKVLRRVLAGEAALPRGFVTHLVEELRAREAGTRGRRFARRRASSDPELTEREWEVLELIATPLSTTVAAQRLGISEVTVRRHISSAVHKLGVRDRAGAVAALQRASVVEWPGEGDS